MISWSPQAIHKTLTYQGCAGRAYGGKRTAISRTQQHAQPRGEWIEIAIPAVIDEATFQAA
jgi:hypothetical protein